MPSTDQLVYIGTYTKKMPHVQGKAEGIYTCSFDPTTGRLSRLGQIAVAVNPSYLALTPDNRFLYSAGEFGGDDGEASGLITAFSRDSTTGVLTKLNSQPSHGEWPCHVSVDATGSLVMAANYRSGSVAAFPIKLDGSLGVATATIQHRGTSVHPTRQQGPHAHSIWPDPQNRFALAADLGTDRIQVYRMDSSAGTLTPNDPPGIGLAPGAGPRHLDFHPNGRVVYAINEIGNTITAFSYEPRLGLLSGIQTVPTLPPGFNGQNTTADVHVHQNGRFVYGSNRGHNSIVAFQVDPSSGHLSYVGHTSSGGQRPRNFAIDPSGRFLLVANQDSDNILTLGIDQDTGALKPTGLELSIPSPVCIRFLR
ncbi:MAG: lactonase family protein [Chloroflexota bacterium]